MDERSLEGSSHLLVTGGFCWSKHISAGALCLEGTGAVRGEWYNNKVYVALRDSRQTKTTEQPRSESSFVL